VNAGRAGHWFTAILGLAVLLLGTLPVSNWLPGGLADPSYARRWQEWFLGSLICAGAGLVSALLVRDQLRARVMRLAGDLGTRIVSRPLAVDVGVALFCLAVYAVAARTVLSGKPLLIDEIVQVLQARTYAGGHLSEPVDSARAFFSVLHVVDIGDRVYSQFPPGWPAMLVVPSLLGVEWLAGPFCGFVAVFVFSRILRRVFPGASALIVPAGSLLFGLAPFPLFQFASHMSHGPLVMWLLISALAASKSTEESGPAALRHAALAGFALGCAFAVRPLDAVAFGVPVVGWFFLRNSSRLRFRSLIEFGLAGGVPVAIVAWINLATTGDPFVFGYEALWGSAHGLGFHEAPWGDAHTPARGLELLSVYVTRLQVYLFESPFPALLPAIAALILASSLTGIEWMLLAGSVLHAALYFAYWHDGFYLGPRFVLPWVPLAIIMTMRLTRQLAASAMSPRWKTGLAGSGAAAILLSALVAMPVRVAQYRGGLTSMRTDYSAEAAKAGVSNAIVFVRESWGARLVARMWALGVSRAATASLYAGVDACVLEHAITTLEQGSARGVGAEDSLRPLLANAARVGASSVSPDTTERMLPGATYDATCTRRVMEDREGYALFPPFLLERRSGNRYVRDLLAADSVLIDRNPGKRYFVVRRDGVDGTAPLRWVETSREQVIRGASGAR
jgi:hypothetical protein